MVQTAREVLPREQQSAAAVLNFLVDVFVSPYHLTTREPPAVASLLLADRVVTLMPAPFDAGNGRSPGREAVERAVERSPKYLRFMQSWQWTMPLWEAGVVVSAMQGQDAAEDAAAVCRRVERDDRYRTLRPLMRPELFQNEDAYLDAVAADLLKGGPDPGVSVPLAAGIDRFAVRHGLMVARSEPCSLAQRAEVRMGQRVFALALPVLLQAGGHRIMEARRLLERELNDLRAAIDTSAEEAAASEGGCDPGASNALIGPIFEAARAYVDAYNANREAIAAFEEDEDEPRMVEGLVAVTAMTLPADAVLRSSVAAMNAMWPSASRRAAAPVTSDLPVVHEGDGRCFVALLIKAMGRGGMARTA